MGETLVARRTCVTWARCEPGPRPICEGRNTPPPPPTVVAQGEGGSRDGEHLETVCPKVLQVSSIVSGLQVHRQQIVALRRSRNTLEVHVTSRERAK